MPVLICVLAIAGLAACGTSGTSSNAASSNATSSNATSSNATNSTVYSIGDVEASSGQFAQDQHDKPVRVAGIPGVIVQVATSNSGSYALTSTGTVWAWGAGAKGQLGDGSATAYTAVPVKVDFPAGVKITKLPDPAPYDSGMAIDSTGDVWGWGANGKDSMCLSGASILRPEKIPLAQVTLATGAGNHSLYYTDGKVYACGNNADGELGDGSTTDSTEPVAVAGLPRGPVTTLVSSWQGSGALMASGDYYDWGYGVDGQLGDGRMASSPVPVRVPLDAAVTQVSQGGSLRSNGQTIAILKGGSVWAWGDGRSGQLGDGKTANSAVPVRVSVPAGEKFTQVYSGGAASYAITASGELWAWGDNRYGELGTGSGAARELSPVPVGIDLTEVSATAANVAGFRA